MNKIVYKLVVKLLRNRIQFNKMLTFLWHLFAHNIEPYCPRHIFLKNQVNWIIVSNKKLKISMFQNDDIVAALSKLYLTVIILIQSLKSIGQFLIPGTEGRLDCKFVFLLNFDTFWFQTKLQIG